MFLYTEYQYMLIVVGFYTHIVESFRCCAWKLQRLSTIHRLLLTVLEEGDFRNHSRWYSTIYWFPMNNNSKSQVAINIIAVKVVMGWYLQESMWQRIYGVNMSDQRSDMSPGGGYYSQKYMLNPLFHKNNLTLSRCNSCKWPWPLLNKRVFDRYSLFVLILYLLKEWDSTQSSRSYYPNIRLIRPFSA